MEHNIYQHIRTYYKELSTKKKTNYQGNLVRFVALPVTRPYPPWTFTFPFIEIIHKSIAIVWI